MGSIEEVAGGPLIPEGAPPAFHLLANPRAPSATLTAGTRRGRGPVEGAQRHGLSEDAGDQRLLLPPPPPTCGPWAHPVGRQVQRPGHARREAQADHAVPEWTLTDVAKHSVDFWL